MLYYQKFLFTTFKTGLIGFNSKIDRLNYFEAFIKFSFPTDLSFISAFLIHTYKYIILLIKIDNFIFLFYIRVF